MKSNGTALQPLPSPNGSNGRDVGGRFAKGNPGGPGNPHARKTASLRAALLDCVTEDDMRAIVATLLAQAKQGDLAAIREVLDRVVGKPLSAVAVSLEMANEAPPAELSYAERQARVRELCEQQGIDPDEFNPQRVRQALLSEPSYLDYLRQEAIDEDA